MKQLRSYVLMGILLFSYTALSAASNPEANAGRDTTIMLCRYGNNLSLSDLVPQGADVGAWQPNTTTISPADGDQTFLYIVDNDCGADTSITTITVVGTVEQRTIDTTFCDGDSILVGNVWFKTNANATAVTYDLNACIQYEDKYKIRVSTPIPIQLSYDTIAQCGVTGELEIDLTENVGYTYAWSDGYTGSDRTITESGRYIVTGTINNGCAVSDTVDILFHAPPKLWIDPDTLRLDAGDTVRLNPITDNGKRIQWSPSDDLSCSDCWQPTLTAKENKRYTATTYDAYGCQDTTSLIVQIRPQLDFPTVFSPSATTVENRYFGIISNLVKEYDLQIFDRWGNAVYHAERLTPQPMSGWDGNIVDREAVSGIYVYHIQYVDEEGQSYTTAGTVTLLR